MNGAVTLSGTIFQWTYVNPRPTDALVKDYNSDVERRQIFLINGYALDDCFRLWSTCQGQRISPLARQFGHPRTSLSPLPAKPPQIGQGQWAYAMLRRTCRKTCFDHPGLVMVNGTRTGPEGGRTPPQTLRSPEGEQPRVRLIDVLPCQFLACP